MVAELVSVVGVQKLVHAVGDDLDPGVVDGHCCCGVFLASAARVACLKTIVGVIGLETE